MPKIGKAIQLAMKLAKFLKLNQIQQVIMVPAVVWIISFDEVLHLFVVEYRFGTIHASLTTSFFSLNHLTLKTSTI